MAVFALVLIIVVIVALVVAAERSPRINIPEEEKETHIIIEKPKRRPKVIIDQTRNNLFRNSFFPPRDPEIIIENSRPDPEIRIEQPRSVSIAQGRQR